MELKEKELKNELGNHNVTNEYLLDQLHQVKSLESKLALVCSILLSKSTEN